MSACRALGFVRLLSHGRPRRPPGTDPDFPKGVTMRSIVATRFLDFTEKFEGYVEYMYVDIKGLVTIGFGNLIDPISYALALPFVKKAGNAPATQAEITAEWKLIKDAAILDYTALAPLTALKLTREAIQ